MIEYYPTLSWIPIDKNILSEISDKKNFPAEVVLIGNKYINLLKSQQVENIENYIELLYENIEKNEYPSFSIFCKTILKDLENLHVY